MKPSRYNITLPDEPNTGEMIIFNTLSGSLFVLEPEYRQSLEALQNRAELSAQDEERLEEMQVEGFVVGDGYDENQMTVHHFRTTVYDPGDEFSCKVMTTMACNLACEYCFESHMDRAQTLSLETAQKVVEKIQGRVEDISAQKVAVEFYGGEPLLNTQVIKHISAELGDWCRQSGRTYSFGMTTNGTLLTGQTVEELLPLGLSYAKVSLDGVKAVQDARRPFRNGHGSSYEVIMRNLHEVCDRLPVTLNTMYSEIDPSQLDLFLDDLEGQGLLHKLASIQPGLVSGYLDQEGSVCNPNECEQDAATARQFLSMLKTLAQRGVRIKQDLLASSNCSLTTSAGAWVFNPRGDIYKCPLLTGREEHAVDSVESDMHLPAYYQGMNAELWRQCLEDGDCPYLPMCGSGLGCRIGALAKEDDMWGMACSKEFFEFYVPEAMRMEVAREESAPAD